MPTLGSAAVVTKLDAAAVAAHHARLAVASNLGSAVAGDVDPDEVAQTLSASLADLNPGPYEVPEPANEAPLEEIRRAEIRKALPEAFERFGWDEPEAPAPHSPQSSRP